jgi:hypothetical protein
MAAEPPGDDNPFELDEDEPSDEEPSVFVPPRKQPIPLENLNLNGFSDAEKARLSALMADLDFRQAVDRREQMAIACKHLREFEGDSRFTYDQIGHFFGVHGQVISAQYAKSQANHGARVVPPFSSRTFCNGWWN